jgi:hypothetical protein
MRLGRRAPSNKPAILFADVLKAVPDHPLIVNYTQVILDWAMLGNDAYGDCGPVSVANYRALVSMVLGGHEVYPTEAQTLDLYRRSGNPNFPNDDNGVDMQTMLEEVVRNGIADSKAVAFAKVDVTNLDEVRAAIAIFGGLLFGVNLNLAQQAQPAVWDYVPGSGEWGGHAILGGDYTSLTGAGQIDLGGITWARYIGLTDFFWSHQAEEAWVVIWPEHFGSTQFLQGMDLAKLATSFKTLTGRTLPIPAPSPVPPSPLVSEIHELWTDLGDWLRKHGII